MRNSGPGAGGPRRRPPDLPPWFVVGAIVVALALSAGAAALVYSTVRGLYGRLDGSAPEVPIISLSPLGSALNPAPPAAAGTPAPAQTWQCATFTRTVTVLLTGIDQRTTDPYDTGPYRTDTMILITLDPLRKTVTMLSIPRDLWVTIPDYGYGRVNNRINTANAFGDGAGYPGGGPALAMKTVQLNLGVRVDHYARVNFTAFEDFIDLIGGIDVVVPYDINDPKYPTGDYNVELYQISAGQHHLNGVEALKYARTRHTIGSDFDRTARQQQVLLAVRDKVMEPNRLPQLLARAPELTQMFRDSVQTDLTLNDVACLAELAKGIPRANIRSASIDENYTLPWKTPEGWDVLLPKRDEIAKMMVDLFGTQ